MSTMTSLPRTLGLVILVSILFYAISVFFENSLQSLISIRPSLAKISSLQSPFPSSTQQRLLGIPVKCDDPLLSCQTTTENPETCCFNYPGGLFLQTQFWDAHPAVGPADRWTVHGLWLDHCDGSYDQYCDGSRTYHNISSIISNFGRNDLLLDMTSYWKDYQGIDENLWKHEWNKHGTCISTLETKCYQDYVPQQEVLAYFDKTIELFKSLNSYKFLTEAGIYPSHERTYDLAEIQAALQFGHGCEVTVRCRSGSLSEIWYYFNVAGSVQTGIFEPAEPDGLKSNCPSRGIGYAPKVSSPASSPTRTTETSIRPSPTSIPFTGRGYLDVFTNGQRHGCIISRGAWYGSGTCARFLTTKLSHAVADTKHFVLASSKGPCLFENGVLVCDSKTESSLVFSNDGGKLSLNGSATFFASAVPTGWNQEKVYYAERPTSLEIIWRPI